MKWVLLLLALALASQVWLCFRVGRSNVGLAIATFFLGSVGALYTLLKHRGSEETSVTAPFLINLAFSVAFLASVWLVAMPLLEAQALAYEQPLGRANMVAATRQAAVAPVLAPSSASVSASASAPLSATADAASAPAPTVDPVDALSQALTAAGLNHVVTRLPEATQLPAGVSGAALYSVVPVGAASAPATAGYSATLFVCESARACRNLAAAQMQQSGSAGRRVLQNELLLLSTPAVSANDADLTPAAVASTFRKL